MTAAPHPPDQPTILVIDDEEAIRLALSRFLRTRGFDVELADSGAAALALLDRRRVALVLCDIRMPGVSGMDLLPQMLDVDSELAVLMLSAVNDAATAAEALSRGAYDYLVKPVDLTELQHALERALHRRTLRLEQRRVEGVIRDEVAARTRELEEERERLRSLTVRIAESLVNAMEAKSVFLRGHSQRVAELGASIATVLGLDEDTVEAVRLAGRLHDVGKIGVREAVLDKPGPLGEDEIAHVRQHVATGLEILGPLSHLGVVLDYVRDHHERWNGGGYPNGTAGEAISIGGRILAAADTYDAMTSERAYREPLSPAEALEQVRALAGTHLDPRVAEALRIVVLRRKSLVFIE